MKKGMVRDHRTIAYKKNMYQSIYHSTPIFKIKFILCYTNSYTKFTKTSHPLYSHRIHVKM